MSIAILFSSKANEKNNLVLILDKKSSIPATIKLSKENSNFIVAQIKQENHSFLLHENGKMIFVLVADEKKQLHLTHEALRKAAHGATASLNKYKTKSVDVVNASNIANAQLYVAEGMALSNYQFIKYFKDASKKKNSL